MRAEGIHLLIIWTFVYRFGTAFGNTGCDPGFYSTVVEVECTESSCSGICKDDQTCCHEDCFTDNSEITRLSKLCDNNNSTEKNDSKLCSDFEELVKCMMTHANISEDKLYVCVRDVLYFLKSYVDQNDFYRCPCDEGYRRLEGPCPSSLTQCTNETCVDRSDKYMAVQVCCMRDNLFPADDICQEDEKVMHYWNASTVLACSEMCERTCLQPSDDVIPVCCTRNKSGGESTPSPRSHDAGLSGGVIALIVIFLVMLVVVGVMGGIYLLRIKNDFKDGKLHFKRKKSKSNQPGFEANVIAEAQIIQENVYENRSFENETYTGVTSNTSHRKYQVTDDDDDDDPDTCNNYDDINDVNDDKELSNCVSLSTDHEIEWIQMENRNGIDDGRLFHTRPASRATLDEDNEIERLSENDVTVTYDDVEDENTM